VNLEEARQNGLSIARSRRLSDGRRSRATKRTLDYRANDLFFSTIVAIGRDLLIHKLSVTSIAEKYSINRKTVWRYKKRLMRTNA